MKKYIKQTLDYKGARGHSNYYDFEDIAKAIGEKYKHISLKYIRMWDKRFK